MSSSCAGSQTLEGVDVSHYQGTIDWTSVKAAGISFAFAKATESTDDIDPDFATNWSAMKAAGIVRGAYHFFDPAADATSQVTYCLATVGTLETGDLPIVLDFEQLNGVAEATAVAEAVTFLEGATSKTGKTAILYMSSDFLSGSYPALASYTLWVANYGVTCPAMPSEWSTWGFWQSSDTGTVSGISGETDLDTFNGALAQLGELTGGSSSGSGSGSSSGSSSGGSSSGSSSGSSGSGGGSGGGSSSGANGSSGGSSSGGAHPDGGGGSDDAGSPAQRDDAGGATPVNSDAFAPAPTSGGGCALAGGTRHDPPVVLLVGLGGLLVTARRRRRSRVRAGRFTAS